MDLPFLRALALGIVDATEDVFVNAEKEARSVQVTIKRIQLGKPYYACAMIGAMGLGRGVAFGSLQRCAQAILRHLEESNE